MNVRKQGHFDGYWGVNLWNCFHRLKYVHGKWDILLDMNDLLNGTQGEGFMIECGQLLFGAIKTPAYFSDAFMRRSPGWGVVCAVPSLLERITSSI